MTSQFLQDLVSSDPPIRFRIPICKCAEFVKYGVLSAFCLALASMPHAHAQPKFSADVPKSVTTHDNAVGIVDSNE